MNVTGWKCPGCGAMWAPHVDQCRGCAAEKTSPDLPAFGPTVGEIWEQYRVWGERELAGWKAVKATAWRRHLYPVFASLPWRAVTHMSIDAYVAKRLDEDVCGTHGGKRKISPTTVNNEIVTLKACFSWAVKRRLIHENPILGYPELRASDRRGFFVSEADFLALLRHAPPVARWFIVLAFETGCRRDELRLLEPSEIDWTERFIRLPAERTKTRRARDIPLSSLAAEILRDAVDRYELAKRMLVGKELRWIFFSDRHPTQAFSKTTLWRWLHDARRDAGVKGPRGQAVWWHSLRKSFASILAGEGHVQNMYLLMDLLGHTTKGAHDAYVKLTPEYREKLRAGIDSRRSGPGATSAAEILKLVRTEQK